MVTKTRWILVLETQQDLDQKSNVLSLPLFMFHLNVLNKHNTVIKYFFQNMNSVITIIYQKCQIKYITESQCSKQSLKKYTVPFLPFLCEGSGCLSFSLQCNVQL